MRITGGILKGRFLKSLKNSSVRPTTDKVRLAIFSKLHNRIKGAKVLDLFAGTGSFGIEAYSRGASKVVFIDRNVKILKENLDSLNLKNLSVVQGDFFKVLQRVKEKFDIIFIDPPYSRYESYKILEFILKYQVIENNGILIYEESVRSNFAVIDGFELVDEKTYGETKIYYLEKGS